MVGFALEAAEIVAKEDGIDCEVINLRSIKPMDKQAIVDTVMKTNRAIAIEEGWPQSGISSEIISVIMESQAFNYLDAPVERITGLDIPLPYAPNLEIMSLPQVNNIVNSIRRTCYGLKK